MTREELLAMGVPEDKVDAIVKAHGKSIQAKNAELSVAQGKLSAAEATIVEKVNALKELGKDSNNIATLTKERDEALEKITVLEQAANQGKIDNAVQAVLSEAKARDPKLVAALLDSSKITMDDKGEVTGVQEQVAKLMKDSAYLFQGKKEPQYNPAGGTGGAGGDEPKDLAGAVEEAMKSQLGSED